MRIDRSYLWVRDLEAARLFFEKYFGVSAGERHRDTAGRSWYLLTFDEGSELELVREDGPEAKGASGATGALSLSLGSKQDVDDLTLRLFRDGYRIEGLPCVTSQGRYESCVLDGEGNRIHVAV